MKKFLTAFIGMVLTSAALILTIPPLFGPHEPYQVWITGVLACLAAACAVGAMSLRPAPPSDAPGAEE